MQDNKMFAQSSISCLELTVPSSVHTHVSGDPSPKCTELHIPRENLLSNGKVMGEMLGWSGYCALLAGHPVGRCPRSDVGCVVLLVGTT